MPYYAFYMTDDMPKKQIGRIVMFMREHADRSTRGMSKKWKLHWHHDRVGVAFDLLDDCRFFQHTYADAFKKVFGHQISNTADAFDDGEPSHVPADLVASIRARIGR